MEGERQRVKEIEYVLVSVLFRIRSPQDCFQDRPCNRIQEAFSSEPCLGYVLFNIVLRHVVTINIVLYTRALAQATAPRDGRWTAWIFASVAGAGGIMK
jgi:hypothetical protein